MENREKKADRRGFFLIEAPAGATERTAGGGFTFSKWSARVPREGRRKGGKKIFQDDFLRYFSVHTAAQRGVYGSSHAVEQQTTYSD